MGDELINTMGNLARWLRQSNWKIYYNQKNKDGYNVFHANTNSKPDMLIEKNNKCVLIEVKSGNKHQDILNGYQQTLKYAGNYWNGRTVYKQDKISNKKIDISAFVLATNHSLSGYLYNDESNQSWMDNSYLKKEENIIEKPISHSITRLLWRQWSKGAVYDYYNMIRANKLGEGDYCPSKKPKIGTLLSRVNRKGKVTGEPHLFLSSNIFLNVENGDLNRALY